MAHTLGLPIPSFDIHLEYEVGIIRWYDDFFIHPSNRVKCGVGYYHHMLSHLTLK